MAIQQRGAWYWQRFTDGSGSWHRGIRPPGEDLAALRSGLGRPAGTAPRLWPFYVSVVDDDRLRASTDTWQPPASLEAEHHALALYGLHQQSQRSPMHRADIGMGDAVRALKQSGKFSEEAVDRRFAAAATATSLTELVMHLRGLISQMRSLAQPRPLDYSRLVQDLSMWAHPEQQQRVRRRWGGQYFAWSRADQQETDGEAPDVSDDWMPRVDPAGQRRPADPSQP